MRTRMIGQVGVLVWFKACMCVEAVAGNGAGWDRTDF
jgi:hypothetical protein